MATSYTPNVGLGMPANGDTGWSTPVNQNVATLDSLTPVGALCVRTKEIPSASLNVAVAAGNFRNSWGSVVAYAGTASYTVTASATTNIWLNASGTLTSGTSWPTGSFYVPLASVVAGASSISSVTDARVVCGAVNVQSQPTMGAATATSSYTSVEQGMLNAVYSAVRALGLGT